MKTIIEADSVTVKVLKKCAEFLRQTEPRFFNGTDLDVAVTAMFRAMCAHGCDLPTLLDLYEKPYTIQSLEEMYEEHGYCAIINDGKLIGFQREKTL